MKKVTVLALMLFALTACKNPKDVPLSTDSDTWNDEVKSAFGKLPEDDKKAVMGYVVRAKIGQAFGGLHIETVTIGEAIERQHKWAKEKSDSDAAQEALKKQILEKDAAFQKALEKILTVSVLKKTLLPSDYQQSRYSEEQYFKLAIKNSGSKDIAGVEGKVFFYDMFDKEQGELAFSYDEGIKAGEAKIWEGSRHYNQFLPEHKSLALLGDGKYTTRFKAETIVFLDGTKLKAN